MQECMHKRKIMATDVDCCTEGNVLSNNIDIFISNLSAISHLLQDIIFLLKECELASIFHKIAGEYPVKFQGNLSRRLATKKMK